jgi:hypothetical protein
MNAIRIRVEVDNAPARAEVARLQLRAEQSEQVREDLEMLLQSGVATFTLVPLPSIRRNEVRYRAELSDHYWYLLEREAV